MKNPLPIGFGARLKELIAEGLPAKEAMKEAWREVKKSRTQTRTYSGSREIFGRKRRKNPKRSKHYKTSKGIFYFPTFQAARKYAQDNGHPTNRIIEYQKGWAIQLKVSGPYVGSENHYERNKRKSRKNPSEPKIYSISKEGMKKGYWKIIDQDGNTIESGYTSKKAAIEVAEIRTKSEQLKARKNPHRKRRKPLRRSGRGQAGFKFLRKARKNPIAIYNPPGKLLYGRAYIPVIRGIKTNGKYKGERYQHNFSKANEVSIYGNPDGSIIVKSNNNLRLWDYDKDI